VPGEWYSPTQPFPTKPPAYDRQGVSPDDLIDFTPELHAQALDLVKNYVTGPLYTPPTLSKVGGPFGTLIAPGVQGGTNWPGGCYDPETCKVYVYSKTVIQLVGIVPNTDKNVSDFAYVHGMAGIPPQAQHAPFSRFDAADPGFDKSRPVLLVCASGGRSKPARSACTASLLSGSVFASSVARLDDAGCGADQDG